MARKTTMARTSLAATLTLPLLLGDDPVGSTQGFTFYVEN